MTEETNPNPEVQEEDLYLQIAQQARLDTEVLADDLAALGEKPVHVDRTQIPIIVAIPHKAMPSREHPHRAEFIRVYCQPLSNGHLLINFRGANLYMANSPDAVIAENPKEAGALSLTSGHSERVTDKKTGRSWLRNVATGGLGINQNGFRWFFCTTAARKVFESLGTPFDDGSPTSLAAQAKGSTLLNSLRSEAREHRIELAQAAREKREQDRGRGPTQPQYARQPAMTTGGPAGQQPVGQPPEDVDFNE